MTIQDLDLSKTYSYADYLSWKLEEKLELIKGKIFKMAAAPNSFHQEISASLLSKIWYYFGAKECKVFHAPFDVRLPIPEHLRKNEEIQTVVQPDICVICDLNKIDKQGCLGAPDWTIEITSPGTSKRDQKYKFEVYESAGVKEYWMVFPHEQSISRFIRNDEGKYVGLPPVVKGEKVSPVLFPNLEINLDDVFPHVDIAEDTWEMTYVRM